MASTVYKPDEVEVQPVIVDEEDEETVEVVITYLIISSV